MKHIFYPAAALSMGIIGFGLRKWQLAACFDEAGLPVRGPALTGLMILTVAAVLAALALSLSQNWSSKPLPEFFAADRSKSFLLRLTALPYLMVVAALVTQPEEATMASSAVFSTANVLLPKATLLLALLAAAGIGILPGWTDSRQQGIIPLGAVPVLLCDGVLLIHFYQLHANDPVVLHFAWMSVAGIASMAAWLFLCSMGYSQKPKTRAAVFFAFLAVVLCTISLADNVHLFLTPFYIAQIWWFSIQLTMMAEQS